MGSGVGSRLILRITDMQEGDWGAPQGWFLWRVGEREPPAMAWFMSQIEGRGGIEGRGDGVGHGSDIELTIRSRSRFAVVWKRKRP